MLTNTIPQVPAMPIDLSDAVYRASCERARADLIAFRLRNGLNPDPDSTTAIAGPRAVLACATVTAMPLRLHLEEGAYRSDRLSVLAVRIDELIEQGYSPDEIRAHLDKVDAANGGAA